MEILFIWLAFAVVTAMAAVGRGRSGVGWFFIGLVTGIFGLIAVLVMPQVAPPPQPWDQPSGPRRDYGAEPSRYGATARQDPAEVLPDSIVNGHAIWRAGDGFKVQGRVYATRREAMDHAEAQERGSR